MTEEVQDLTGVDPVPTSEVTATDDGIKTLPDADNAVEEVEEEKKFSQADLDALIGKRLAREQRKWEREQSARQVEIPKASELKEPLSADQFESPEAYRKALIRQEAAELVASRDQEQSRVQLDMDYAEREESARDKYDDFDQVVHNPKLRITDAMAETIKASEIGPDIAYWFGNNPKEADRVSRLSPLMQAREIGKIEAKVSTNPPEKKISSAPSPIRPVAARNSSPGAMSTTDPRSTKTMSPSEWIEADRRRRIELMRAQQKR